MISNKVADALQKQITMESETSLMYLSMSTWCESQNLTGSAALLLDHSGEERTHMLQVMKFLQTSDIRPTVTALAAPKSDFVSVEELFQLVYDREVDVTNQINLITKLALEENDFASFGFLQSFVKEQHEGLVMFRDILELAKNLNLSNYRELMWFDKSVQKVVDEL